MLAELVSNIRAEIRKTILSPPPLTSKHATPHVGGPPPATFPGPYLAEDGATVNRPRGTSRVSPLLGYAEYQNQYVSSKTTKLFNPFTSGGAYLKAVRSAQEAGELVSLDQVVRLLEERGAFARREGQEHHESAADYDIFISTFQRGLTDLDRLIRLSNDGKRTQGAWAAVLRSVDRLMEHQWAAGLRWSAHEGQVDPVLMGAVMSAGYSAYYAMPSLPTLKEMLSKFEGLVDSEGYRADRRLLNLARNGPSSGPPFKKKKGGSDGKGGSQGKGANSGKPAGQ
jgi:hypothetical protein